jgi:hypothetical protein
MTDHELDAALASALDVDHSPEFVARVRTRVAAEAASPSWYARRSVRMGLGASFSAAALVAVLAWPGDGELRPVADAVPGQSVASAPAAPMSDLSSTLGTPQATATAPGATGTMPHVRSVASAVRQQRAQRLESAPWRAALAPDEPRGPEVVVSADEARAFRLLVERASQGLVPARLPGEAVDPDAPIVVSRIEIDPVTIEPLPRIPLLQ